MVNSVAVMMIPLFLLHFIILVDTLLFKVKISLHCISYCVIIP